MPEYTQEQLEMMGIRPASEGGGIFCGVSEDFAINNVRYQWPRGMKLTWGIGFSRLAGLSDMDCKDAVTAALKEISDCCDISHEYVTRADTANINIIARRLDGPSGVLADCQIPMGNVNAGTTLLLRMDDSERYGLYENPPQGSIDAYRVLLHELEHAHGLGHKPANVNRPALIAPLYSAQMRNLQAADKEEFVLRYGPRQSLPTNPTNPPVPTSGIWIWVPGGRAQAGTPL